MRRNPLAEKLLVWLTKKGGFDALGILSDHLGKVVETVAELNMALLAMDQKRLEDAQTTIQHLKSLEEEADRLRKKVGSELQKGKLPPLDREDVLHVLRLHDRIADWAKEAAVNLGLLLEAKKRIPDQLLKTYQGIAARVLDELKAHQTGVGKIATNFRQAWAMKDEVELIEHDVDVKYIEAKRMLLFAYGTEIDLPTTFVLRDVLNNIEYIADLTEDASDLVQLICIRVGAMLFASE